MFKLEPPGGISAKPAGIDLQSTYDGVSLTWTIIFAAGGTDGFTAALLASLLSYALYHATPRNKFSSNLGLGFFHNNFLTFRHISDPEHIAVQLLYTINPEMKLFSIS